MKMVYCDVCGQVSQDTLMAGVMNGEDCPGGSITHIDIDICMSCLKSLDLQLDMDLTDMKNGSCKRK